MLAGSRPPALPIGAPTLPPDGYLRYCSRVPLECGDSAEEVIFGIARQALDRMKTRHASGSNGGPASIQTASGANTEAEKRPPSSPSRNPAAPARPNASDEPPRQDRFPRMSPRLWALLTRVDDQVNHAIVPRSDALTSGFDDYWSDPIEEKSGFGDCEDYVLSKQHMLLAEGLPRNLLNIALVSTPSGESHAVLLVSTREGDLVLDNLSPWISLWRDTPYSWSLRQVNGNPLYWVAPGSAANSP